MISKIFKAATFLTYFTFFVSVHVLAADIYFTQSGGLFPQNGTSWANAFPANVFAAQASSAPAGTRIFLGAGSYTIPNSGSTSGGINISNKDFEVYGGYPLAPAAGAVANPALNISRIVAAPYNRAFYGFTSGTTGCKIVFEGITIDGNTGGLNDGNSHGIEYAGNGSNAAITSITIRACRFVNNKFYGLKIDNLGDNTGNAIIVDNSSFENNGLDRFGNRQGGGGLWIHNVQNGAVSVSSNTFNANQSNYWGTGANIEHINKASVTLRSNTFTNNQNGSNGGGLLLNNMDGNTVLVANNTFANNSATNNGGGAYLINLRNGVVTVGGNTFTGNKTQYSAGGGLAIEAVNYNNTPPANINGNSFCSNSAAWGGGIGGFYYFANIHNNSFKNNSTNLQYGNSSGASIFSGVNNDNPSGGKVTISNNIFYNQNTAQTATVGHYASMISNNGDDVTNNQYNGTLYLTVVNNGIYSPGGSTSGNTANSTDPLPGGCPVATSLPVAFGAVKATINNDRLNVNWETLSEKNVAYFAVQASVDGVTFKTVGKVEAQKDDSESLRKYNFTGTTDGATAMAGIWLGSIFLTGILWASRRKVTMLVPVVALIVVGVIGCSKNDNAVDSSHNGKVYVRIMQVDKDGAVQYSKTITAIKE